MLKPIPPHYLGGGWIIFYKVITRFDPINVYTPKINFSIETTIIIKRTYTRFQYLIYDFKDITILQERDVKFQNIFKLNPDILTVVKFKNSIGSKFFKS